MVTRDDVLRAARLARLALEPEEVDRLTAELEQVLRHVEAMGELDVAGVPPFEADAVAPVREDVPGADPLARDPSAIAPAWRDGFFTVPRLDSHREPGDTE